MRGKIKSDFAAQWLALMALVTVDLLWARAIGFHLTITWNNGKLIGLGLLFALLLRQFWSRGGLIAEYFSLSTAATASFAVLSYLCLASSGALADGSLQSTDRALGFDWMAGYRFLLAHPLIVTVLKYAYNSMLYQGLYFGILFALMGKKTNLREMFWLVMAMGIFTSLGVLLFPALGPFKQYSTAPAGSFLPEMEHIKSGRDLNFALDKLTGVVSFPSFHTAMALAYIWGFRNMGAIGWGIALLNLLMLCAIPWFGGHYLTDMIAGAAVMLLSLVLVKMARRLWTKISVANASPGYAAASGDAY